MPGPTNHDEAPSRLVLDLPDAEVVFYPAFFPAAVADRLLREVRDSTAWRQDSFQSSARPSTSLA